MIKYFSLLFLLFISFNFLTHSVEVEVSNLPAEYKLLIKSWSPQVEVPQLEAYVARHESIFKKMTKEDRFSLIKIEIYRFLIRNRPKLPFERINSEMISKMIINTDQINIESFSDWVFSASISDIKNILNNKKYDQLTNSEKKRLRLAASWPYVIFQFDREYFKNSVNKLIPSLVKTIEDQLILFSSFSHVPNIHNKDLIFFSIQKKIIKKKKIEKDSAELPKGKKDSAIKIVEEVKNDLEKLPQPVKDWIRPSDLAKELSPLKQFKKNKDYIVPNKLPEPTDDWLYNN